MLKSKNTISKKISSWLFGATIVIVHEFHRPPYGGGNQFLLGLRKEFRLHGYQVGTNRVGVRTKVVLFNSFNFDFKRLRRLARKYPDLRFVHRVDGPIGVYRGVDSDVDRKIWQLNHDIADATIFQSQYSLLKHQELGLHFVNPVVIYNTPDGDIFNRKGRIDQPDGKRKIRIIATSWSDNPKKGGPFYKWLEENLDWNKFEFTFVGRTKQVFQTARHIPACQSEELAEILKKHDIYITASQDDPCSNALLEALACGLPALFLNSGGHAELVKDAGIGFISNEEALVSLRRIADFYDDFQRKIVIQPSDENGKKYLDVLCNGVSDGVGIRQKNKVENRFKRHVLWMVFRVLFSLDTWLERLEGLLAIRYDSGLHPKHRLTKYHDFFIRNIVSGQKILDIGCGNGVLDFDMAQKVPNVMITGVELSLHNIQKARQDHHHERVNYVHADALSYDFKQSFDIVVMSNVLEHVEHRVDFLKQIIAKCQPKYFLIRVPMYERDWRVPFRAELRIDYRLDGTHFIEHKLSELKEELALAGLRIEYMEINWGEYWLKAIPD